MSEKQRDVNNRETGLVCGVAVGNREMHAGKATEHSDLSSVITLQINAIGNEYCIKHIK